MNRNNSNKNVLWPSLQYENWHETLETLHMWTQIVGKVKLTLSPFINQWWEVAFYVTPRGMTTGRIPYKNDIFAVYFDFISHKLTIQTSKGSEKTIALRPSTVANFYQQFMQALHSLNIKVNIHTYPSEVSNPIAFAKDTHHKSYNSDYVTRWWQILIQTNKIFDSFRTPFRGKSSPIHFFWGSFDLAGTRFSGKKVAPPSMKGEMKKIMKYAENEENFAFGFWPGNSTYPHAAYYTYMYPKPAGMETINFGNTPASFHEKLAECILPYDVIQKGKFPADVLMKFLQTSYKESARLAGWNRKELEGSVPSEFHL